MSKEIELWDPHFHIWDVRENTTTGQELKELFAPNDNPVYTTRLYEKDCNTGDDDFEPVGGAWLERFGLDRHESHLRHQPRHTSSATRLATAGQLDGDPPRAVAPLVFAEDASNHRHPALVLLPSRGELSLRPGVIGGATHLQGSAQRVHGKNN